MKRAELEVGWLAFANAFAGAMLNGEMANLHFNSRAFSLAEAFTHCAIGDVAGVQILAADLQMADVAWNPVCVPLIDSTRPYIEGLERMLGAIATQRLRAEPDSRDKRLLARLGELWSIAAAQARDLHRQLGGDGDLPTFLTQFETLKKGMVA